MIFEKKYARTYAEVNTIMSRIATPLSLYLVPVNEKDERARFFSDDLYNPRFSYRKADKNKGIFTELSKITEISDVDPAISDYILKTIESKREAARLLSAIGNDQDFPELSKKRFGVPSYKLFGRACKILRGKYSEIVTVERDEKRATKEFSYNDLVGIFNSVFEILGLDGWRLEKSKAISSRGFRTVMKTKRVMVDPEVVISAEKLRKTIVHEVATHALRGNNGYATGYDIFGKPNMNEYLDDEEGLAMFNEETFGVLRKTDVKKRAALVFASYLARKLSFRDLFDALSCVYHKNDAYDVCLRVKRGLSDSSLPGGYYRDACYLRGYFAVKRKLTNDEVTYRNMYAGKISLSHIDLVEEGILRKPKVYPTKELIEKIFNVIDSFKPEN